MKHFYRLLEGIVILPTMAALVRHPELWDADAVILRTEGRNCEAAAVLPHPLKVALDLMQLLGGTQLEAVGLWRLEPKATARDSSPKDKAFTRYRILLHSQPGVQWSCGDEAILSKTGDCWWMSHGPDGEGGIDVRNKSDDELIVLACDIRCEP